MVNLENPENHNSEIAANTSEAGTSMKLLIFNMYLISNVIIKRRAYPY